MVFLSLQEMLEQITTPILYKWSFLPVICQQLGYSSIIAIK